MHISSIGMHGPIIPLYNLMSSNNPSLHHARAHARDSYYGKYNKLFRIAYKWHNLPVVDLNIIKRIHFLKEIQMRGLQNVKGG